MLNRLMIEQNNLVNTQLQCKTTLKFIMKLERSTLTMRQFVKELRQTWFLSSRTTTFHCEASVQCQRSRIDSENREPPKSTCSSTRLQTKSFTSFLHSRIKKKWFIGHIELCELLDTEPNWCIGIVYCTCGHFLREGREVKQKFTKYTMDILSIPDYYIQKGRPHGHRYGKKPEDKEYYIANQLKKCMKKNLQNIHDRFSGDEQFRSRMVQIDRTEDFVDKWMILRTKIIPTIWPHKNFLNYQSNWWLRSNKTGSDTMPIRRRSDFKQALSTLQQLKEKEE